MYLIILIVVILAGLILFGTLTRHRPEQKTLLLHSDEPTRITPGEEISLLTWNIGYAGLGQDMDFFYDGGKKVRSTKQQTLENHQAILEFLQSMPQTDFMLLQEVDQRAKRSHYLNTPQALKEIFSQHWHAYGTNYRVNFVPVPFYAPMGYVHSGILTTSKPAPILSERISFPGSYPWPDRLFNLDRCMILNRYPVSNGKQLIVVNTHNSAFDDGSLRLKQMAFMKEIFLKEYNKGNYVIAGGDWNQCPPGFEPEFSFNLFDTTDRMDIPEDFLPGWQWAYDPSTPTNRRLKTPYHPASSPTTLIDFFLLSPNVELIQVQGFHLDFKHSDHNPVLTRVELKN